MGRYQRRVHGECGAASGLERTKIIMGNKNGTPVLREQDIAALSKSSGMDTAQVKEHFNAFLTAHPNGKMKPKEFREMVEKTMPKSDASKMEKHVFRIYDTNNDGYIDFVEFMLVFYIMSDGTPQEVLEKIFRVFDANSDGTITKKELTRLIKDMYGLLNTENAEQASKDMIAKSAFAE